MLWLSVKRCFGLVAVLLLSAACHDAERNNPLDPALTPAVDLEVALDDTAGTAALTWTRYVGEQPFATYFVLRNVVKSTEVDTLEEIADVGQTAYVDASLQPDTAYEYRVAVVNQAGLEIASNRRRIDGFATGAVHLTAPAIDPLEGAVRLTWSRYRDPGFARYEIYRRQVGTDADSLLGEIGTVDDTAFVDRAARHGVDYVYRVLVRAFDRTLESNVVEAILELPAVEIGRAAFDAPTAPATLEWSPYVGPHFEAYQIQRTVGSTMQIVARLADLAASAFVDSGLTGDTGYTYRVMVQTVRGETVASGPAAGRLHGWIASWPLDLVGVNASTEFVRLYAEGDRIAVLVVWEHIVRLLRFDTDGQLLEEQALARIARRSEEVRFTAATRSADGRRLVSSGSTGGGSSGILLYEDDGRPVLEETALFDDVLPAPLDGAESEVQGEITLSVINGGFAIIDSVSIVAADGSVLLEEDFAFIERGAIETDSLNGWEFSGRLAGFEHGGALELFRTPQPTIRRVDSNWRNFHLNVIPFSNSAKIQIGGEVFSRFTLQSNFSDVVELFWDFTPPDGAGGAPRSERFDAVHSTSASLIGGYTQLSMGISDGIGLQVLDWKISASWGLERML